MINLLPGDYRKELSAARSNSLLIRYIAAFILVMAFLGASLWFIQSYLKQESASAEQAKIDKQTNTSGYTQAQTQVQAIQSSLSQARSVFSSEIRYSKVLLALASTLPEGTALNGIQLDKTSFEKPTTFTILIKGESAAAALRTAFSSSQVFANPSFGKLSINDGNSAYPYSLEVTITINRAGIS